MARGASTPTCSRHHHLPHPARPAASPAPGRASKTPPPASPATPSRTPRHVPRFRADRTSPPRPPRPTSPPRPQMSVDHRRCAVLGAALRPLAGSATVSVPGPRPDDTCWTASVPSVAGQQERRVSHRDPGRAQPAPRPGPAIARNPPPRITVMSTAAATWDQHWSAPRRRALPPSRRVAITPRRCPSRPPSPRGRRAPTEAIGPPRVLHAASAPALAPGQKRGVGPGGRRSPHPSAAFASCPQIYPRTGVVSAPPYPRSPSLRSARLLVADAIIRGRRKKRQTPAAASRGART